MSVKQFLGLAGPPKPAGGGDPWGSGIASAVGAWLASQPDVNDQRRMQMERDLYGARTDLVKAQTTQAQAEAGMKQAAFDQAQQQRTALQNFLQKNIAVDWQQSPDSVGPPDPNLSRPSPWEAVLAGVKPDDLAQMYINAEAMAPQPNDSRMRTFAVATGKPVGVNQAVSSAELDIARALDQQKIDAGLRGDQMRANATVQAARLRATSGGGESFAPVETQNGMMMVNKRTGDFSPMMDKATGQPVMGKQPGKPVAAAVQKQLADMGDTRASWSRLAETFKPDYGGQPFTGDAANWIGRTFGDNSGQSQWWQDYQGTINLVRNQLFGSALTKAEQDQFNRSSVQPGMNPDQIQQNLNRQAVLVEQAIRRRVDAMAKAGADKDQLYTLTGLDMGPRNSPAPAASPADPLGIR